MKGSQLMCFDSKAITHRAADFLPVRPELERVSHDTLRAGLKGVGLRIKYLRVRRKGNPYSSDTRFVQGSPSAIELCHAITIAWAALSTPT
jgi:hypothetical protein